MMLTLSLNTESSITASRVLELQTWIIPPAKKHSKSPFPFSEDTERLGQEMDMYEMLLLSETLGSPTLDVICYQGNYGLSLGVFSLLSGLSGKLQDNFISVWEKTFAPTSCTSWELLGGGIWQWERKVMSSGLDWHAQWWRPASHHMGTSCYMAEKEWESPKCQRKHV